MSDQGARDTSSVDDDAAGSVDDHDDLPPGASGHPGHLTRLHRALDAAGLFCLGWAICLAWLGGGTIPQLKERTSSAALLIVSQAAGLLMAGPIGKDRPETLQALWSLVPPLDQWDGERLVLIVVLPLILAWLTRRPSRHAPVRNAALGSANGAIPARGPDL